MWHFRSKCQRIGASIKASHKRLKVVLASKVRNFGSAFIAPKLDEFSFFDNFFLDLADFRNLDNFLPFEFLDFLVISLLPLTLNLSTLLSPTFSCSGVNFSSNIVVFSIEVSGATILLKLWMNC